jgi:hypothetical protein
MKFTLDNLDYTLAADSDAIVKFEGRGGTAHVAHAAFSRQERRRHFELSDAIQAPIKVAGVVAVTSAAATG